MVLDDASPQAGAYESGSSYSGQNGDYMNMQDRNSALSQYYIRPDQIIKPDVLTMYFGFFGKRNWSQRLTARLINQVEKTQVLVERLPTQSEMDAFATITSRNIYYTRLGIPLGFAAGMAHLYQNFRKSEWVPVGMRNSPTMLWQAAKMFWRNEPAMARTVATASAFKLFIWAAGVSTASALYATYRETKDTLTDPRLSEFLEELRRQKPEDVQRRRREAVRRRFQKLPQAGGGAYAESHEHGQDGGYGESDEDTINATQFSRQGKTPDQPRVIPDRNKPRLYADPATTESPSGSSDFFGEYDDASPTAPEYRNDNDWTRIRGTPTQQGSAWERIRQQNIPSREDRRENLRPTQQGPESSSYGIDKQREREQAKADFEKLLEAERNVSEASGPGGRNGGWGSQGGWGQ